MAPKLPRTISSLSQSAVNQLALDLSRLQFAKTAAGTSAASLSAVSRLAGSSGLCEIQARRTFFSRTMAGLAGSLDGSGSHWGQNAVRIAKRNSSSSNGPPKRTKVVRQSGRTRSEITYETNSGTFGGAGQVVRPLAAAPGVSVRRWRVWGTKRKPTKAKKDEPETYQQKKNKFPANPLKLDYDDAYMLADQVRWMVEKRGLHALALELIRRHALKDRTRELDARDDRRGAGPALKRRDEDVRRQSEERDEYEEADEGLMTWKWSMRSADDAVWNTFISACAIQGEYGWAEAGYQMMLRYRAKPSKITRLALLNALGNAIALEAPPAIPVLHTQPSPPLPEPLPVPFTPASAKDYYLPSLLARIPGPNFDSAMLASLLRIFARTESWPEFDRTANRFVLRDAQAPLPNWVQQVGTESLNPKVTRNLQGRKGEDRYLAHPKHAPEPDAVVFHTALSHLARREDGWEKAQILWEALGDEELEKDAELVNAYLACAAGSEWPSKTVRLAAEEFGLPDEAWDGQKVEELADVKVVARKHGTKRKAKLDGEAERDGELPVPNLKTLSILLEACLQSGKKSSEVSAKVVGWWRAGRFELGPERGLDDYSGFLLARAIGVALSPSEKSVAEVESAAEKLWVFYTVGTANGLVEPRCPRTAGVVLDACWKAVSSIAATREAVEGGKAARLEIWASRGAEVWKPYEKGVRALTIPGGQKSEGARTMLYLFVGYARLLIDLRFDQRNKDHVARMLTTGLELLRAERGPASLAKIKTIVAATMRKLANEAITDEDACKEYVAEIKATGWWSVDHKWDSRMGRSRGDAAWDRDAGTRSEDESDMRDKKGRRAPQIPSDGFRKVA